MLNAPVSRTAVESGKSDTAFNVTALDTAYLCTAKLTRVNFSAPLYISLSFRSEASAFDALPTLSTDGDSLFHGNI